MKENIVSTTTTSTKPIRLPFLAILKRHQILAFFLLSFGISWGCWFLLLALQTSNIPFFKWNANSSLAMPPPAFLLFRIGGCGPAITAIILTALVSGKQGLQDFFRRFVYWRVGLRWYAVALFSFVPITLAIVGLYILFVGPLPGTSFLTTWYSPFLWFVLLLPLAIVLAGLPEEPGWRGYALPQLLSRYNPLLASLILGFFWGLWHLPIFILDADYPLNFLLFLLQTIPLSILFTWIYLHTKKSLLISILFHAAIDTILGISLSGTSGINGIKSNLFVMIAIWAAAIVVVALFGTRLTRTHRAA